MVWDRAFHTVFRNFSTLFLLVAAFTVPLHLAYSFAFRNVIEVSELHAAIQRFPPHRQVHSVGREQLTQSRLAFLALTGVEIALIPILVKATQRVIEVDAGGGVPTVADALSHARGSRGTVRKLLSHRMGTTVAALAIALVLGFLTERTGLLLVEPLGDRLAWAGVGLVRAISRAIGAPFFLVPAAMKAALDPTHRTRAPQSS